MKQQIKLFLKRVGIYYSLQGSYRGIIDLLKKTFSRLKYLPQKGKGFTCNVCGAQYASFVPWDASGRIAVPLEKYKVIAGYGENVFCPNCYSTSRERLVIAVLKDRFKITGKDVLHMSPERAVSQYLKANANVISTDIEPGFYTRIDKNILHADICALPFRDDQFDFIIANHILEHIPDDDKAMRELKRVLKPGGTAVLQVPFSTLITETIEEPGINDPVLQEKLFGQKDHVRIYAADDYVKRLEFAGFKVEVLKEKDLENYQQFAIQQGEWVFLCS